MRFSSEYHHTILSKLNIQVRASSFVSVHNFIDSPIIAIIVTYDLVVTFLVKDASITSSTCNPGDVYCSHW